MNKSLLVGVLIGFSLTGIVGAISLFRNTHSISSFAECAAANNRIAESYPRQCYTEDGRVFVENIEEDDAQVNSANRRILEIALPRTPKSAQQFAYTELIERQTSRNDAANFIVEEIILGPTAEEKSDGFFTPIKFEGESNCEGADFKLELERVTRVAIVKFCRPLNLQGLGNDMRIQSSVVRSLSLLPEIDSVVVLNHTGSCLVDLSETNACVNS